MADAPRYDGHTVGLGGDLVATHMPWIAQGGVAFEYELSTRAGWASRTLRFDYETLRLLLAPGGAGAPTEAADGVYRAAESRVLALVVGGREHKMAETEMAEQLFWLLH